MRFDQRTFWIVAKQHFVNVNSLTSKSTSIVSIRHVEALVACAGVAKHPPQASRRVLQPNASVAGASAAAHVAALQNTHAS